MLLVVILATAATPAAGQTAILDAVADTYLKQGSPNKAQGAEPVLRIKQSGKNRSLVRFASSEIEAAVGEATLVSAHLELFIEDSGNNWGSDGRTVDAHRLSSDWTEAGATWNCADDLEPNDQGADCDPRWDGGAYAAAATATVLHTSGQVGPVLFDVTADVASFLAGTAPNYGWLVRKSDEGQSGRADYTSREGVLGQRPRLVLEIEGPIADATPPALAVLAPGRVILDDAAPQVTVEYSDGGTGVDLASLQVLVDATDISTLCNVGAAAATCPAPTVAAGTHTISASIADLAGNIASVSHDFELLLGPGPHKVAFEVVADSYLRNGVPNQSFGTESFLRVRSSGKNRALVRVDEGEIAALIGAGTLRSAVLELFVEANGGNWGADGRNVDLHRLESAWSELAVTWNCGSDGDVLNQQADCDPTWAGGAFDPSPADTVLHTSDLSGIVAFDVTADLDAFLLGTEANHGWIVKKTDEGQSGLVEYTSREGAAGPAPHLVVTFDSDSVPEPDPDVTAPRLAILAPPPGVFVSQSQPDIEVSFSDEESGVDETSLAFTVNAEDLAVSCSPTGFGARCVPSSPLPEGGVDLVASVSDLAGNSATASVRLLVDTVGLEVTITEPAAGLVTRDAAIAVSGTAEPDVSAVTVNAQPAAFSGGRFSATVELREGVNMVVALATKANGRTGTASIEVVRDLAPPVVRIDSPRDGFVAVHDRIAVTGLVNDVVGGGAVATVAVNGIEVPAGFGTFMLESLQLVPGPNLIEAVATDAVGNEGRHSVSVVFQPPAGARIASAGGNGQTAGVGQELAEPLVAVVTDVLGNPVAGRPVRFEVSRNSGTLRVSTSDPPKRVVQVPTDGAGRAAVRFTLGDTAGEGNHRVRASALGVAGEVELCASALAAAADKILMVDGDDQRGLVGHALARPLEALVVDTNGNPIAGLEVIFQVIAGTGSLDGQPTVTRATGADGLARVILTLGNDPGINNNVVAASFDGLPGLPAVFNASSLVPGDPAQTGLSGVVLDNGRAAIPGAVVRIETTDLVTMTDEEGQFLLEGVPVGRIVVEVDPAGSPRTETFPPLAFEMVTVAGQENHFQQPILVPAVDLASARIVGGNEDVSLTMDGVEGFSLTIAANSATFPDGSRIGELSVSQVHLDKVPMAPPSGTIFMPPAWTIQPAGVVFDPPARITIPNDGLPPGRVIDIFQFDHTANAFINVGKGTVSEDGFLIASDPGFGITRSGWGGCGTPQPATTQGTGCKPCERLENNACVPDLSQNGDSCSRSSQVTCAEGGFTATVVVLSSCGVCNEGVCGNKPPFGADPIEDSTKEAIEAVCGPDKCIMNMEDEEGRESGLRKDMIDNLFERASITVSCVEEIEPDEEGEVVCGESRIGSANIRLASAAFQEEICGTPRVTILHELVHAIGDRESNETAAGCEAACFPEDLPDDEAERDPNKCQ